MEDEVAMPHYAAQGPVHTPVVKQLSPGVAIADQSLAFCLAS